MYDHTYIHPYMHTYIYAYIDMKALSLAAGRWPSGAPLKDRESPTRVPDPLNPGLSIHIHVYIIYIYIYTHMCIYIYMCVYIYIYIYIIERERERERFIAGGMFVCVSKTPVSCARLYIH